ncbi:MAG: DUF3987 domain-containing protein [Planctomycetota bacterium]
MKMPWSSIESEVLSGMDGARDDHFQKHVETFPGPPADDVWHGLAGEYVRAVEPHSEADPIAILVSFLVGFGNLIGRTAHFCAEATPHYCNLYAVLVGQTSKARKGSSTAQGKRPLESADPTWFDERIETGLSSGEGVISAVADEFDEAGNSLVTDKRLFVIEEEFARALRAMERDGNTLSHVLRSAWDSGNLRILTRKDPLKASNVHLSLLGHITKFEVNSRLSAVEVASGLANRILWIATKRSKYLPSGGRMDETELSRFSQRVESAVTFARTMGELRRDAETEELWRQAYPLLERDEPGLLGSVTARAAAQTMRLAVLFAVLDECPEVRAEHLYAAGALWEYALRSAKYIFGTRLGDTGSDKILEELRKRGSTGMSRSEIRDNLFAGKIAAGKLDSHLAVLVEAGLARMAKVPTGGRPTECWYAK